MPALPSWLTTPLWDQFAALLPQPPTYHPDHPLGCHQPRVADRVIFDKLVQVLVFGCGYRKIADQTCSATTIRDRRDQWIAVGVFATLELLVLGAYDRMIGLDLDDLAVDGCITKAPCGGDAAGRSPGGPRQARPQALHRDRSPRDPAGHGRRRRQPPRRPAARPHPGHLGPARATARAVHGASGRGYDSRTTREVLAARGMTGQIAVKGTPAPIQASRRWPVERTHAWGISSKSWSGTPNDATRSSTRSWPWRMRSSRCAG